MLASLALGLAAQSIVSVQPAVVRAAPHVPLAAYVSRADYPASARQRQEEGTVAYSLIVGPDGRVAGCDIARSSGSSALDNATCRIMRSRARFAPARDASGQPTADARFGELSWRLAGPITGVDRVMELVMSTPPQTGPAVEPARARASLSSYVRTDDYPASAAARGEQGRVAFELAVGPDGRVTDCRIARSSGSLALDNATCRIMRSRARFTPARDANGNPTAGTSAGEVSWNPPSTGTSAKL